MGTLVDVKIGQHRVDPSDNEVIEILSARVGSWRAEVIRPGNKPYSAQKGYIYEYIESSQMEKNWPKVSETYQVLNTLAKYEQ